MAKATVVVTAIIPPRSVAVTTVRGGDIPEGQLAIADDIEEDIVSEKPYMWIDFLELNE